MKPSGWDKQLGLVSPRERAASQSDQTNTPSKNKVRNEVGLDVSHHARISQRGGEMPFFLDILFHRMSEMAIFQHLNFAETFVIAPLGVRFKFADASGIRSNLPQLSYVSPVTR